MDFKSLYNTIKKDNRYTEVKGNPGEEVFFDFSFKTKKYNQDYQFMVMNEGKIKELTKGETDHPEGTPYSVTLINFKNEQPTAVKSYMKNTEQALEAINKLYKEFL